MAKRFICLPVAGLSTASSGSKQVLLDALDIACASPIYGRLARQVDCESDGVEQSIQMPALLVSLVRFARLLLSGYQAVAAENAGLCRQLAAFQRRRQPPLLPIFDRVFWSTLRRFWSGWRGPLIYIQPDTVVRWERERFRRF